MINKILPDLYRITLPMPFRLSHVHIHALVHDGKVTLFDVGMNTPESLRVLERGLATLGKTMGDIDQIFLSHFHVDHCGIAGEIQRRCGAVVWLSEMDEQQLQNGNRLEDFAERALDFYVRKGLPENTVDTVINLVRIFQRSTIPFRVDRYLNANGRHMLGNRILEIIHTPGHTSGQMCFYFPEDRILLSGDHILPEITPNLSPNLFDLDYRPLRSFLDSLEYIRDLSVRMVCPAHGAPFPDLVKRVDEIIDHHSERKQLIVDALQGKRKTPFEISLDIFGKDLPDFDQYLALNETYVHLVDLVDSGIVKSEEIEDRILFKVG